MNTTRSGKWLAGVLVAVAVGVNAVPSSRPQAFAQPPAPTPTPVQPVVTGPVLTIPAEVKAEPGQWVTVKPATTAKSVVYVGLDGLSAFPSDQLKDPRNLVVYPAKGRFRFVAVGTLNDEQVTTPFVIVAGDAPVPPGPTPVDPPSPDDKPKPPVVVSTFRVVFVSESGDNLTAAQRGVIYGKDVEAWLNGNCTGGKAGWRRKDRDNPSDPDPTMAGVWEAAKPKVTGVPCVAVQTDDRITIVSLDDTPATMIATLTKYKNGGK